MTCTHLCVLVSLRLLNYGKCRGGILLAPASQRDTDMVHTIVVITSPTIQEDVGRPGEPKFATRLRPLIA